MSTNLSALFAFPPASLVKGLYFENVSTHFASKSILVESSKFEKFSLTSLQYLSFDFCARYSKEPIPPLPLF